MQGAWIGNGLPLGEFESATAWFDVFPWKNKSTNRVKSMVCSSLVQSDNQHAACIFFLGGGGGGGGGGWGHLQDPIYG